MCPDAGNEVTVVRANYAGSRPTRLCQGSPWHLQICLPGRAGANWGSLVFLQILRSLRDVVGLYKRVRSTCQLEVSIPGICFMEMPTWSFLQPTPVFLILAEAAAAIPSV